MKKTVFVTIGIILSIILLYIISGVFLTCKKPIKSSYVLLEDWISYSIVDDASNYIIENNIDSVFIVGMKNPDSSVSLKEIDKTRKLQKNKDTYGMYWSGILGFEIPSYMLKDSFSLNMTMHGNGDNKHFPHYEIYMNKQLFSTGFVNEHDSAYKFNLSKNITDSLTYILINFDNDISSSLGDRNLYVSNIYVDTIEIESIATDNFFLASTKAPNIDFSSKLNNIKYYLKDLDYDTSKVKLIEVDYDPFNKTLALAKGAKKYFNKTEVRNFNIITAKKHSRRSYLNFKNCLEENINVGCIPQEAPEKENYSLYDGLDERISVFLTWIYWWFY